MKHIIKKYRNNRLSPDEIKEIREKIDMLSEKQIAEAIYDDWHDYEPQTSDSDAEVEARVLNRLKTNLGISRANRVTHFLYMVGRIAAVALICLLGYSTFHYYSAMKEIASQQVVASTGDGERANITLPDGSLITLNHKSSIIYAGADFSGEIRRVKFDGEAYFDITHLPQRPFIVETPELEVLVKGTIFNLLTRRERDTAVLSLIEGNVQLTCRKTGETVELKSNEKAILNYDTGSIAVYPIGENDNTLAWRLGRLTFVNATYDEVIAQLQSHYDSQELSLPSQVRNERFTGVIPLNNLDVALEIVNTTFPEANIKE